jgi:hypothetical protein
MKLSHLLLAASLFTFTAAAAQTTPLPNGPGTAPGAPGTTTASPSAVPSGTAPVQADPDAAVTPSQVFTKGAPLSTSERRMQRQKNKAMKTNGKHKMKAKM